MEVETRLWYIAGEGVVIETRENLANQQTKYSIL